MTKNIIYCLSAFLLLVGCSSAPVEYEQSRLVYNYKQLKLMEIDEVFNIVDQKIAKFKKTNDPQFIEEALTTCLSRPDNDNILEKTMAQVRISANPLEVWNGSVESVVDAALTALAYEKTAPVDQVTYTILLQNLLLEYRTDLLTLDESLKFERKMIQKIKDAKILISSEAKKESSLNLSMHLRSPSEVAADVLVEANSRPKSKKN